MATITEDYCSYEVAKLLKEKGFDEPCMAYYTTSTHKGHEVHYDAHSPCNSDLNIIFCNMEFGSLPTHQMAVKWLREVYNICITIYPDKENGYEAVLYNIKDDVEIILQSFGIYGSHIFEDSYEEAVEVALKYCLENLI